MGRADYWAPGDWNAACALCGHKFKASMLRKHWTGDYRCELCWEPRQPQDWVKAVPDDPTPPWVQPQSDVYTAFCTPNGATAIATFGIADCMIADFLSPAFNSAGDSGDE